MNSNQDRETTEYLAKQLIDTEMPGTDGPGTVGLVSGLPPGASTTECQISLNGETVTQLDDVVVFERELVDGSTVKMYGVISELTAIQEGAEYESDVYHTREGLVPSATVEIARVSITRFSPEIFVPPLPGSEARKAVGQERAEALMFSEMAKVVAIGLSRDGEPIYANYEFIDGTRGAHVNISGVSGVATKTSYATFLLYSIFNDMQIGRGINDRAVIFNVKGEDLLFLDKENINLSQEDRDGYAAMGLPSQPFKDVMFYVPPGVDGRPVADTSLRQDGVRAYYWTLYRFCKDEMLPHLFADGEDSRNQYSAIVYNVANKMRRECKEVAGGGVQFGGTGSQARTLGELCDIIESRLEYEGDPYEGGASWLPRNTAQGTTGAFLRRLRSALPHVRHLIRGDAENAEDHRINIDDAQVSVVDINSLNDRAQRFVVGTILKERLEQHERSKGLKTFVMLDELNKFAPRNEYSTIEEILLDIAERGRSMGMILLGAQQTASEVERRIVSNASLRVVGRMDVSESTRPEYGFLPREMKDRATIIRPGTMIVMQPEIPVPLMLTFPHPSWATRAQEVAEDKSINDENIFQDDVLFE